MALTMDSWAGSHYIYSLFVAVVAQLVEPRIVIPVVAGSSPVDRPIFLIEIVSAKKFKTIFSS